MNKSFSHWLFQSRCWAT